LQVFERDEGGYHALETIFLRLSLHDTVELGESEDGIVVAVEGEAAADVPAGPENICWRAAKAFFHAVGQPPRADIRLSKRIPAGTGLGGGSADAAAVLRLLNSRARRPLGEAELLRLGGELGSDVPFALLAVPMALGWERGRRLLPLRPPSVRPALVWIAPVRVQTREAYAWLSEVERDSVAGALPGARRLAEWETLARLAHNDFEPALFSRYPELASCREALRGSGSTIAGMTGSGSALYGIFPDEETREAAAEGMITSGFGAGSGWQVLEADLPL
jgi:4-diphosphocytidyl-2-C-methyl-D-erythritol kinase